MRYRRQEILPHFQKDSQLRLAEASVLVLGCGGLASTVLPHLCAAGVGTIGIVDADVIHLDNLHRQTLFGDDDIGLLKVHAANARLKHINPNIQVNVYATQCSDAFASKYFPHYDLVIETTDSMENKIRANHYCGLYKKPLVYGAVYQYEGQMSVFHYAPECTSLADVFGTMTKDIKLPTCAESGVWPTLVGIIGMALANEALKIITQIGTVQSGIWGVYDALSHTWSKFTIKKKPSDTHSSKVEINIKDADPEDKDEHIAYLQSILNNHTSKIILVLNGFIAWDAFNKATVKHIPYYIIDYSFPDITRYDTVILTCQSGFQSKAAMLRLQHLHPEKKYIHTTNSMLTSLVLNNNRLL